LRARFERNQGGGQLGEMLLHTGGGGVQATIFGDLAGRIQAAKLADTVS
jgi:hypothetical protein